MDWKAFEAAFITESQRAINKWFKRHPKQHAYAFAFHESYRELDAQIALPWLGVNSLEKLRRQQGADEVALEWNPADWAWTNILPARSKLAAFEAELFDEASRSTQAHWFRTEKKFLATMVRVAKALRRTFAGHPQTTDDFVAYFDDEDGGLELIRKCVTSKLFKKHFARFEEPELDTGLSQAERVAEYFADPYTYEEQILALGEDAVSPLIKLLEDEEQGWVAASLLGDLGVKKRSVINALRKQMSAQNSSAAHSARSLCLLGDVEFLFGLIDDQKTRSNAVSGILTGLTVRASNCPHQVPLNYRPAERLLAMKSAPITRLVTEEIKPGSSLIEIKPTDVEEALRGLESKYVVIRQHAVCVLGDRGLGKPAGKIILPKLAERLYDKVPNVRRLTLLALRDWKAAARAYHAEMKKLQKEDDDADVRYWARYVFD